LKAVTPADVKAIVKRLVEAARGGDVQASKVLLDRCLGQPLPCDVLARLESLEKLLESEQ